MCVRAVLPDWRLFVCESSVARLESICVSEQCCQTGVYLFVRVVLPDWRVFVFESSVARLESICV